MPKLTPGSDAFAAVGATLTREAPVTTSGIIASDFRLSEWSRKASLASDDAMRVALGQLARTRGLPDATGVFDGAISMIKRPLELRGFSVSTAASIPLDLDSVGDYLTGQVQDAWLDAVGVEMSAIVGQAVGDFVGAVPVVGGIIRGFYDVVAGLVAYRGKVPEYENAFPTMDPAADRNKADAAIEWARSRAGGDWRKLFSPPGLADQSEWASGFGDLDLPGNWWAVGAVDFWDPSKPDQQLYPDKRYGRGVLGDLWLRGRSFGGCPRLNTGGDASVPIHLGVITSPDTGAEAFDAGRFLPTTAQTLLHLWTLARNPVTPYIMCLNAEWHANEWLRYAGAFRNAMHCTHAGGTDRAAPTQNILVKWAELKSNTTIPKVAGLRRQARVRAVNAMASVFGWEKWNERDDELLGNPRGLEYCVDRFNLRASPMFKAWDDLYARQRFAARSATVAYLDGTETAFIDSELRRLRTETLGKLVSSRAALYVDPTMVEDQQLRERVREIQTGSKDPTLFNQGADVVSAEQRRGARLQDLIVKENTIGLVRFATAAYVGEDGTPGVAKIGTTGWGRTPKAPDVNPPKVTTGELEDGEAIPPTSGAGVTIFGLGFGAMLILRLLTR